MVQGGFLYTYLNVFSFLFGWIADYLGKFDCFCDGVDKICNEVWIIS